MPQSNKFFNLLGYAIPLLIFLATAVLLWVGLDHDPRYVPSPLINKPVPDFSVSSLRNPHKILNQNIFIGHISLLNVWATWCGSCKEEHAMLVKIANLRMAKRNQLVLYGLNYKDSPVDAAAWLARAGNPYREVLVDTIGRLGVDLGVYGTPETYLIDKKGIIRYKHVGPITQAVWDEVIWPEVQGLV